MALISVYLRHFISVCQHKYFVFLAGRKLRVPLLRLIFHDWTKFTPAEFGRYARYSELRRYKKEMAAKGLEAWLEAWDSSGDGPSFPFDRDRVEHDFALAWLNHENRNRHHWGYWIPRSGVQAGRPLPMPAADVREMVADWHGASRAYEGQWDIAKWVGKNVPNYQLHPDTAVLVRKIMSEAGYIQNFIETENPGPWDYFCLRPLL